MACRVELTRAAQRDRDSAVEYLLDARGKTAAAAFLGGLDGVLEQLRLYPYMHPASQEARLARMGYRKALFGSYLALYRVEDEQVMVMRIFHQRQDYARLV